MSDFRYGGFRLLAWLRWRQWRASALYWLRLVGYDPQHQGFIDRLYALYLIVFGLAWVTAMGLAAVTQAAEIGRRLPLAATQAFLGALPWLFIAAAMALMVRSLRASPVLLSFPDMAYVAASPLDRAAVVLVNFLQSCIQHWIVVLPVLALVTVVVAQPLGQELARTAALRAAAVAAPSVPLLLALTWTLGLVRLNRREHRGSGAWWLAAFLLAPLAWLIPALRWPGTAAGRAIGGGPVLLPAMLLSALALLAAIVLARVAASTNLIAAAEESRTYARLNALGLMAFLAPDVSLRIRRQEALSRRRAKFRLVNGHGTTVLDARSVLFSLRHPSGLAQAFLWGMGSAFSAAWLVLGAAPLVLWFFWVSFLVLAPPKLLVESFQSDMESPYLRQLLPISNGALALRAGIVPTIVLLLGAWVGWGFSGVQFRLSPGGAMLGAFLALEVVMVLLLTQAAATARISFFGWRAPYAAWLLITLALVGVLILLIGPLAGAPVGFTLALLLLAFAVWQSEPVAAD